MTLLEFKYLSIQLLSAYFYVNSEVGVELKLEIPKRVSFLHLGSIISKDGEIEEDIKHWIRAGWFGHVLCRLTIVLLRKSFFVQVN